MCVYIREYVYWCCDEEIRLKKKHDVSAAGEEGTVVALIVRLSIVGYIFSGDYIVLLYYCLKDSLK